MKSIIASLLGILTISYASTTDYNGKQVSWDSTDNEETGSTQSYSGIVVKVFQDDGESPTITLGTDKDDHEDVYCLNFKGTFESDDYDTSVSQDATFTIVSGSEVDLAGSNCITNQVSSTEFTIICDDVNAATLKLTFIFTQDTQGDYGLEYTVGLDGYSLESETAIASDRKLVMVQSLIECSEQYPYSADNEGDNNNDDTSTTDEPEEDEEPRRLAMDSNDDDIDIDIGIDGIDGDETDSDSMDEEDGISSDDSNEFDAGTARFVTAGQAFDKCEGADDMPIGSKLVYQSNDDELHIVFEHFNCDLSLDPFVGLDRSKYEGQDQAASIQIMIGMMMGLIAVLLL